MKLNEKRVERTVNSYARKQLIAAQCATIAEEYHKEQLKLYRVGKSF